MLGSTILNRRQHVGLQKLSALAGVTHSCLGPNKKYKFIQDDASEESTLVCSCFRIFENLELTCAVGQLVYETIQAHHKIYRTGSGCLLFLAGAWSRVALECLHRGISVAHIVSTMFEGMDICLDVCRQSSISIEDLHMQQSEGCAAASHALGLHLSKKLVKETSQTSCHLPGTTRASLKTLKLSRHFCEDKFENVSTVRQPHQTQHPDIAHIAEGLSHGCLGTMNLVIEASRIQSNNNQPDLGCSTFDVSKVVTCVLPGLPEDHACVVPGCVVLLSAEQASVARNLQEQCLQVALIHGDLSNTYRHLGFNRPTSISCVSDQLDLSSSNMEEKWMEMVVALLLKLDVNLVLVSGLVSDKVILRCCRHHILVVGKVRASILKAFAHAAGAVPVTYVTQLSKHCVGTGVNAVIWRELHSHDGTPSITINISTGGNSDLVTVVLTSCVHGKLQALEDQFWACAYRLHHVLKDKVVLPGAGVTEILCAHHLQKQAEHYVRHCAERSGDSLQQTQAGTAPNPCRGVVLQLMAEGLIDYISTVMVNTGGFSKLSARTAVSQQLKVYNDSSSIPEMFSQLVLDSEQYAGAFSSPMRSSDAQSFKVYDSLCVKQEAWKKALDLVLLVLQADAEIITGTGQRTDDAQETLLLL